MNSGSDDRPYIAIISGGVGTRLWPRSRRRSPKQLINLAGGRSLIQNTLDRISPLTSPERTFVITISDQQDAVRAQLPEIPPANIIAEPEGRNTAMAIGLAIAHIAAADPNALMISVGSDHFIGDDEAYRATLRAAVAAAADGEHLVTVGIACSVPIAGYRTAVWHRLRGGFRRTAGRCRRRANTGNREPDCGDRRENCNC